MNKDSWEWASLAELLTEAFKSEKLSLKELSERVSSILEKKATIVFDDGGVLSFTESFELFDEEDEGSDMALCAVTVKFAPAPGSARLPWELSKYVNPWR